MRNDEKTCNTKSLPLLTFSGASTISPFFTSRATVLSVVSSKGSTLMPISSLSTVISEILTISCPLCISCNTSTPKRSSYDTLVSYMSFQCTTAEESDVRLTTYDEWSETQRRRCSRR